MKATTKLAVPLVGLALACACSASGGGSAGGSSGGTGGIQASGGSGGADAEPWPTGGSAGSGTGGSAASGGSAAGGSGTGGSTASGGTGGTGGGTGGGSGNFVPNCPASCQAIPGTSYGSLSTSGAKTDRPAAQHADLNPKMRGWAPCTQVGCGSTGSTLGLIYIPPAPSGVDTKAPRLHTLFSPARVPTFKATYRGYDWDWSCNCKGGLISTWDVHWIGAGTSPGEVLHLPESGYDIGAGYGARVLYADGDTVTLKYTAEDNVVYGYTIHIVGICLEPGLRALYDSDNASGRNQLPALKGGDPIGRACGSQTLVAIRDTGSFMDPRSQDDWWQGHP